MGAVHGVYLKYVGLSLVSYVGYTMLADGPEREALSVVSERVMGLGETLFDSRTTAQLLKCASRYVVGYSTLLNASIAVLFKLEKGMFLIGKDPKTGEIPWWSYVVYFPFHLPTILYTHLHTRLGSHKIKNIDGYTSEKVPVATKVQPGFWVGGCYAHELDQKWGGVIDLTVEFPESCINDTQAYLLLMSWDGVPASPDQLEQAANFAMEARKSGDLLVHCAHGRGRSTTVMCACLVKAGMFSTWQDAFEKGIKPNRSVCKLNSKMRKALSVWQSEYVDGKKDI